MSRLRIALACLLVSLAIGCTAVAEAHPRLVCVDACTDDGDQPQPCGDDCGACACCAVLHLVQPAAATTVVVAPPQPTRPYFAEPAPLISREGSEVFHIPKSPLA